MWKKAANTNKIIPIKNSETFFIPVKAALYAAMLRKTWNAKSATSNQLIHLSERLMLATFCGPLLFASFDFLSASFASLIIMYVNPNPSGTSRSITP